jgi:hypothetical protein
VFPFFEIEWLAPEQKCSAHGDNRAARKARLEQVGERIALDVFQDGPQLNATVFREAAICLY